MKLFTAMAILFLSVLGLCVWDTVHTNYVFDVLIEKSTNVDQSLQNSSILDEQIQNEILDLNEFWTKKMDTLCVSISRKDLQPVSDYLQYLISSIHNENQEDAITYSRLLNYNIIGLKENTGVSLINLL